MLCFIYFLLYGNWLKMTFIATLSSEDTEANTDILLFWFTFIFNSNSLYYCFSQFKFYFLYKVMFWDQEIWIPSPSILEFLSFQKCQCFSFWMKMLWFENGMCESRSQFNSGDFTSTIKLLFNGFWNVSFVLDRYYLYCLYHTIKIN